mmetsp:Transcript_12666/g.29140  ORF Transcript_12666/g.29140 Transcript_12666/m.29140 type:complete len:84 (-) Transcript_12666:1316-1567(-)|eukprot:751627-Hanusia_phi.AAC.4
MRKIVFVLARLYNPIHSFSILSVDPGYGEDETWYEEPGIDENGHSRYHVKECAERSGNVLPFCFQDNNADPGIDYATWKFFTD